MDTVAKTGYGDETADQTDSGSGASGTRGDALDSSDGRRARMEKTHCYSLLRGCGGSVKLRAVVSAG